MWGSCYMCCFLFVSHRDETVWRNDSWEANPKVKTRSANLRTRQKAFEWQIPAKPDLFTLVLHIPSVGNKQKHNPFYRWKNTISLHKQTHTFLLFPKPNLTPDFILPLWFTVRFSGSYSSPFHNWSTKKDHTVYMRWHHPRLDFLFTFCSSVCVFTGSSEHLRDKRTLNIGINDSC